MMSAPPQHMDTDRKRRRQSSVKQDSTRTPSNSSHGRLSNSLRHSKGREKVRGQMQLSGIVMLSGLQPRRGRDRDLQPVDSDFDSQAAVAKRTRQGQRRSELLAGEVTHNHPKARDVHLDSRRRHQAAKAEDQNTIVPAKRARQSISTKKSADHDESQQSSVDTTICSDPPSEPVIKTPVSSGTTNRMPGRMGKRRQKSVSFSLQYLLVLYISTCCAVNTPLSSLYAV